MPRQHYRPVLQGLLHSLLLLAWVGLVHLPAFAQLPASLKGKWIGQVLVTTPTGPAITGRLVLGLGNWEAKTSAELEFSLSNLSNKDEATFTYHDAVFGMQAGANVFEFAEDFPGVKGKPACTGRYKFRETLYEGYIEALSGTFEVAGAGCQPTEVRVVLFKKSFFNDHAKLGDCQALLDRLLRPPPPIATLAFAPPGASSLPPPAPALPQNTGLPKTSPAPTRPVRSLVEIGTPSPARPRVPSRPATPAASPALGPRPAPASPGQQVLRYAAAVVPIRAFAADGRMENGSGFVVGSTPDSVYIATAGHVLMEPTAQVQVWLEGIAGLLPAKIRFFRNQGTNDLALVAVAARQYQWARLACYYDLTPDDELCFIRATPPAGEGASKERLPLNSQAEMLFTNQQTHTIGFELDDLRGGDSGSALLVASDKVYITGMIIQSSRPHTAVGIRYIRQLLEPILGTTWQLAN